MFLDDVNVFSVLVVIILLAGESFQRIAFRIELLELAVHLGDFLLVYINLLPLAAERHARTDHLPDIVGIQETDPDQEDKAHDEILVEQHFADRVLLPFPVFFLDFREDVHAWQMFSQK